MIRNNFVRLGLLTGVTALVLGSASSRQSQPPTGQSAPTGGPLPAPPPPMEMPPEYAHGAWESSFGAVVIERDTRVAAPQAVVGTWTYDRSGQAVTGYFAGTLRGNVLDFSWTEPFQPPLVGTGYLVFDGSGTSFSGAWTTTNRDRSGTWTGWRGQTGSGPAVDPYPPPNVPAELPQPQPVQPMTPADPLPSQPALDAPPQPPVPSGAPGAPGAP